MTARAGGAAQRGIAGSARGHERLPVRMELAAFHSAHVERCTLEDSSCGWVS